MIHEMRDEFVFLPSHGLLWLEIRVSKKLPFGNFGHSFTVKLPKLPTLFTVFTWIFAS